MPDPVLVAGRRAQPGRARSSGGIQINSTRGAVARTWWSQRFIGVLEQIGVGGRLSRGRSYARAGQIVSMDVERGRGAGGGAGLPARGPTRCASGCPRSARPSGAQIAQALVDDASYAAALLNGEMPRDIESVFEAVGLTLFPASSRDLAMDCSCPDHEVPCKHLAAVCYVLAERFDADPFEILALRGRDRDDAVDRAARPPGRGDRRPGPGRCGARAERGARPLLRGRARPGRAAGRAAQRRPTPARPDPGADRGRARGSGSPTCCAPPTWRCPANECRRGDAAARAPPVGVAGRAGSFHDAMDRPGARGGDGAARRAVGAAGAGAGRRQLHDRLPAVAGDRPGPGGGRGRRCCYGAVDEPDRRPRSTNFWILPVEVFGSSPNSTALGALNRASRSRTCSMISSSVACAPVLQR